MKCYSLDVNANAYIRVCKEMHVQAMHVNSLLAIPE